MNATGYSSSMTLELGAGPGGEPLWLAHRYRYGIPIQSTPITALFHVGEPGVPGRYPAKFLVNGVGWTSPHTVLLEMEFAPDSEFRGLGNQWFGDYDLRHHKGTIRWLPATALELTTSRQTLLASVIGAFDLDLLAADDLVHDLRRGGPMVAALTREYWRAPLVDHLRSGLVEAGAPARWVDLLSGALRSDIQYMVYRLKAGEIYGHLHAQRQPVKYSAPA